MIIGDDFIHSTHSQTLKAQVAQAIQFQTLRVGWDGSDSMISKDHSRERVQTQLE